MFQYEKPDNLVELLELSVAEYGGNKLFGTKDSSDIYRWVTYKEFGERVDNLRSGLAGLGIRRGDVVGIIANNRLEWAMAAFAAFGAGAAFSPMYENELEKVWKHIISDSRVRVLFVSSEKIFKIISPLKGNFPDLEHIVLIEGTGENSMEHLEETGALNPVPSIHPSCNDLACFIYTSGTTGNPKGVMLTHGNFTSNARAGMRRFGTLSEDSRSLSILPWAHSYGLTAELINFIQLGASIGFMESVAKLGEDMANLKPTFLLAVPRIFNRIHEGIWAGINEKGGLTRKVFKAALSCAVRKRKLSEQGSSSILNNTLLKFYDAFVFKKIRARFGGRLEGALTASATSNIDISHFFEDIGIPTFDAYGMTECSPAVAMNAPGKNRYSSVGRPLENVEVVIDKTDSEGEDDGEIVVFSPGVMKGYHNNEEETRKVLTGKGGMRTGDRGRIDEDGFLYITGRIKEQYKLENGKFVFPAAMEEDINFLPYIESSMVHGENRPFNICLVVLDMAVIHNYVKSTMLKSDPAKIIRHRATRDLICAEIQQHLTGKYGRYEIPKKVILLDEGFTMENGLLTQTMKIKRKKIMNRYTDLIENAYEKGSSGRSHKP